jgi:hypothetical protein
MDERGMKKEGKNREGKGWGIRKKMCFFFGNCYEYFMFKENVIRNPKPR